jgi:hypothetical protein
MSITASRRWLLLLDAKIWNTTGNVSNYTIKRPTTSIAKFTRMAFVIKLSPTAIH